MTTRDAYALLAAGTAAAVLLIGCPNQGQKKQADPPPAGTSCRRNGDCPQDQICTKSVCRYRNTSAAGEVLATSAQSQFEQGETEGAMRTYAQAIDAFEQAEAPLPPRIVCSAAAAALKGAATPDARERAARRADQCFRSSVPGDPHRSKVLHAVSQLRYEGLDPTLFDRPQPADRYFTKKPQRPTIDQIQVALDLPEADEPAFDEMAEALRGEKATRAIADCFIEHWERKHQRKVSASLMLDFDAKLRDMGTYDIYEPIAEVSETSRTGGAFGQCLTKGLTEMLAEAGPRDVGRRLEWQKGFEVAARLQ